jgi:hypothetical protein
MPADLSNPHPTRKGAADNRRANFTAQEIEQIKRLLQEAADEPPEPVQTNAVIGTLSDEIETLRINGMTDDDIAAVFTQSVGATVTAEQIAKGFGRAKP